MAVVTVYTAPGCGQCRFTQKWLDKKSVPFEAVDLSQDPDALAAVKALGYEAAPVVIVNDDGDNQNEKHWYGFRPDLLEEFALRK